MNDKSDAARLWAMSDLHLAPRGEQCVFAAHEMLVALIEHLAATAPTDPPQWLVLNGDVFDFLQIPGYDTLSLPLAPQRMEAILDALDDEPEQRNVVGALRRFTAAGHVLKCLPGNHDAELNLCAVQQTLARRLGSDSDLRFLAPDGFWRIRVAGREVVGHHGHYADAFNALGRAQVLKAQADGDNELPMPPGSRLTCRVIDPFRRAKTPAGVRRFPFIDRMPSDWGVVLAIMLLDTRLAGKRLGEALGIGAAALLRKALMAAARGRPMLAEGQGAPAALLDELDWTEGLTQLIADSASDVGIGIDAASMQCESELDAYFAGQGQAALSAPALLAGGESVVRMLLWRALGKALAAARDGFQLDKPDSPARRASGGWGRDVVAIAGHTHAAKWLTSAGGGVYLNPGTWLDQVLPPADLAAAALSGWLDKLHRDELPCWNAHPVAVVDAAGSRLMRWTGDSFASWREIGG